MTRRHITSRGIALFAVMGFTFLGTTAKANAIAATSAEPTVGAASALLIDQLDGRILWEKNARERRAVASTTKIITALVVLSSAETSDEVTASRMAEDIGTGDSLVTEIGLVAGERITVESLLYAMLLQSANDAAVALAEHVGGSLDGFASKMNALAVELGATDSHFVNPHGLDAEGHYSTAFDLALLARTALQNETFRKIVRTPTYDLLRAGKPSARLQNRNQLLGTYLGADGVKTGQTLASGRALVASASRNEESRIAVVLSSPDPFSESARILDHGFSAFERRTIAKREHAWGYVTYGTGATRAITPMVDWSILIRIGSLEPNVSFSSDSSLVVTLGEERHTIPVRLECRTNPCNSVTRTPLSNILSKIGKVLSALLAALQT